MTAPDVRYPALLARGRPATLHRPRAPEPMDRRCPTCDGAEHLRTVMGKVVCPTCRGSGLALPPVSP